jgi:AGZA family xanthine/uracil permease-like MFS transporter
MGLLGLMIILIFMAYKWRSAMIVGIGFVTVVSWFRNTAVTYFPDTVQGDARCVFLLGISCKSFVVMYKTHTLSHTPRFDYFTQVVAFEKMDFILAPYDFTDLRSAIVALITFLYVDFLDTSGTLMGIVSNMGLTDEHGDFPKSRAAFSVDALATIFGSIFGLSPVTSYIESAGGVGAGSRTGLTAIFVGFFFFLGLFFAPIIASIPPWATGGALVLVGSMMARSLKYVKWHDITHAATAFITVIIMPLTYSIAYGLIAGICVWIVLQFTFRALEFLGVERPHFDEEDVPNSKDEMSRTMASRNFEGEGQEEQASDDTKNAHKASAEESPAEESPVEKAASEQEDA